ncbi:Spermidine hydroxycinnamoyl transferase [Thalictrum thalictroides]|uniref:Spermidine hydroxycinnamoyl transferase n=1 Tax=Thalictrum thalictroides TaxID=46969 RepID=A0A7J6VWI1_THATH|nr:Spermidine hydroxycinnamoyl transferase [Thalictrum thalictroides]
MADITTVTMRTIVSTEPVQFGKYYSLSILGHIMEPSNIRLIFYYPTRGEIELGKTTERLLESLSEMLNSYPIITGRLQKTSEGQWRIKCNDAGVRMIEARATGSVEDWLQKADREEELKLVYWEDMFHNPYFWCTFYIQLTEFEDGGIAIGLSCSHLLADVTCATIFVKAWAETTLFGKMLDPPHFGPFPHLKRGHKLYNDLINCYKIYLEGTKQYMVSTTEKYETVTFAFSDEMVRKCMTESQDDGSILNGSPFAALASLFWLSISKVKGKKELINMSICLDRRNALGLDKAFFGNCMIFSKVLGEDMKEVELRQAAKGISNAMQKMGNEEIMDLVEWLESERDGKKSSDYQPPPINCPDLICSNCENLDPYSSIFEPGVKPIRFSCYVEHVFGEGQVLILPSPEGDSSLSRVAMVTLPEHEVVKLCEEELILQFSPTILMGGKT